MTVVTYSYTLELSGYINGNTISSIRLSSKRMVKGVQYQHLEALTTGGGTYNTSSTNYIDNPTAALQVAEQISAVLFGPLLKDKFPELYV